MMSGKVTLPNDYERMIPEYHKGTPIYGEHMVRYEGARDLVKGKVVLDIASGSGYGTKLLAQTAKKVYGVDVSDISVKYAREQYGAPNVEYLLGDAEKIPLADNSVDIIVSFETIEHVKNYKQFMSETKRILKKDGVLLLSTPNDVEFPEGNHFHLHEFKLKELENLIHKYFKNTRSYYQGTWLYNALLDEKHLSKEWQMPIDTMQTAPITLNQCLYFYILCSNRPIKEEVMPLAAIAGHWSERNHQEYDKTLRDQLKSQEEAIEFLQGEVKRIQEELGHSRKDLEKASEEQNEASQELAKMNRHVLTMPYRALRKIKRTVSK